MCTGLVRRGGRYSIRRRVPSDLVGIVGKVEVTRALGTSDRREAERLCRIETVKLDVEWTLLRAQHAATSAATSSADELAARKRQAEDQQRAFEEAQDYYFQHVKDEGVEEEGRDRFEADVARHAAMLREAHRLAGVPLSQSADRQKRKAAPQPEDAPTLLSDLCATWERERPNAPRTVASMRLAVRRFRELVGAIPVARITRPHITKMRDGLVASGLKASTANKLLTDIGTLLSMATTAGTIPSNPALGIKVQAKRTAADEKQPFSPSDLKAIFSAPRPSAIDDPAKHWLPLLQLWTGARVRELSQLRPEDIQETPYSLPDGSPATTWVLTITDAAKGATVKNAGSRRRVPIHAELIRAGFVQFAQQCAAKRREWLFDLTPDRHGNRSSPYVKWFSHWLRNTAKITDTRLTGHSFRHLFAAACRDCGITEAVSAALMGHSPSSVHRRYGGAYPVGPLVDAIHRLRIAGFDPSLYA